MTAVRFGILKTHPPFLKSNAQRIQTFGKTDALGTFMAEGQPLKKEGVFKAQFYGYHGTVEVTLQDDNLETRAKFEEPQTGCLNDPGFTDRLTDKAKTVLQQYALDLKRLFETSGQGD